MTIAASEQYPDEQGEIGKEWQRFEEDLRLLTPRWLRGQGMYHRAPVTQYYGPGVVIFDQSLKRQRQ